MESDSDDSHKYNLTPMTVEANESLFPTNGNNIPKKQYSTSCNLFYYNGKRAKIINYDLIKHVNPQGFFEVNNNCKIIKMLSQFQMKINIDGTNSPEGSKCHSAIFSLCFCFFFCSQYDIYDIGNNIRGYSYNPYNYGMYYCNLPFFYLS